MLIPLLTTYTYLRDNQAWGRHNLQYNAGRLQSFFPVCLSLPRMAAMASRFLRLLLLLSLTCHVLALGVTPDSPCASQCADSTDTTDADVACEDSRLTGDGSGSKYKQCMSCLQNSTYSQDGESDQGWFLRKHSSGPTKTILGCDA